MARRRNPSAGELVSLFPFLSVLACVVSLLVFVVATVGLIALRNPEGVNLRIPRATAAGVEREPVFVECDVDRIIIYPEQTVVAREDLADESAAFQALLKRVAKEKDRRYILLAVRPKAFDFAQRVIRMVEEAEVGVGSEPVEEGPKLRFQVSDSR